jgi:heme A synthase
MEIFVTNLLHLPLLVLLAWAAWRKHQTPLDRQSAFDPLRIFKLVAVIALLGLGGCASHEKLAVASGPVFPLNPDHWQAAPPDLVAPVGGK